jgi:hypothetical protein
VAGRQWEEKSGRWQKVRKKKGAIENVEVKKTVRTIRGVCNWGISQVQSRLLLFQAYFACVKRSESVDDSFIIVLCTSKYCMLLLVSEERRRDKLC